VDPGEFNRRIGVNESPELLSPRLHLRRLREGDATALCAYRSLPDVARLQSWESFGIEEAAKLLSSQAAGTPIGESGSWLQLGLTLVGSGELVGDCGIHFPGGSDQQVELGITLSPLHQGRGLAAEALTSVLRYAFESLGKHRAWAVTDVENDAAARLFRQLGFRQEAHFVEHVWFKGRWSSEFLFAMLRREWVDGLCDRRGAAPGIMPD
jgi:RimJ/RimL family protein N-acetyltransferase